MEGNFEIEEKYIEQNTLFLGDRQELFQLVKSRAVQYFENLDVFQKREVLIFEIEKLNISVDDIRYMISFANKTGEGTKLILLSSFYWSAETQNALLKVLEETPSNTFIYLFGLSEKTFLKTVLSRVQKVSFRGTNRYLKEAKEVLHLAPTSRLDHKTVKKILSLKTSDYNLEKDTENEKKDREAHILFLYALMEIILNSPPSEGGGRGGKVFMEKLLTISTLAEIEGGSPHLFIEWLLLAAPEI